MVKYKIEGEEERIEGVGGWKGGRMDEWMDG